MGNLPVVPFLIIFPLVIAFLMFVVRADKVRSVIAYVGAVLIMAGVGYLTWMWIAGGSKMMTLYVDTEIADYAILGAEILLMFVVVFLSFKYRKYWISLLSIIPTAGMVWLEFSGVKLNEIAHIRIDHLSVLMCIIVGVIGGLIVLAAMPFALRFANLTDQGKHYLKIMLLINTYYVMGQAVNTTLIAGVFRAGGDSRFGMICDTIDMWCYAVPLGFLAAAVLKLPPLWVYFLLCTDEFVKWPWVLGHYKSKKWLKNITRDDLQLE